MFYVVKKSAFCIDLKTDTGTWTIQPPADPPDSIAMTPDAGGFLLDQDVSDVAGYLLTHVMTATNVMTEEECIAMAGRFLDELVQIDKVGACVAADVDTCNAMLAESGLSSLSAAEHAELLEIFGGRTYSAPAGTRIEKVGATLQVTGTPGFAKDPRPGLSDIRGRYLRKVRSGTFDLGGTCHIFALYDTDGSLLTSKTYPEPLNDDGTPVEDPSDSMMWDMMKEEYATEYDSEMADKKFPDEERPDGG